MTRKHEPSMYVCVLLLITHYSFTQSLLSCFHCQDVKSQGRGATNGPDELLALGQVKDLRTWAGILEHLKMLSLLLCQGESCVFLKKEILSCHRRTAKQRGHEASQSFTFFKSSQRWWKHNFCAIVPPLKQRCRVHAYITISLIN